MKSFLKNYTSDVPVSQTIFNIEKTLIRCGVSGITKEYGTTAGDVIALIFHINLDRRYTIRLPADVDAAQEALWADYVGDMRLTEDRQRVHGSGPRGNKKKNRAAFRDQAARTAWKLQQDFVEVQMSLMFMKQADFLQAFVSYIYDEKTRTSFYTRLKDSPNFLALSDSK